MTPRLDVLGIVTSDLTASLDFYRRLGLSIPDGAESEPHVEVELPGGMRLLFDTDEMVRSMRPDWKPGGDGRIGLAVRCDSPAEVDCLYAELTSSGVTGVKAPWDAFWGQRYATVLDPDGNSVDLYAPLPAS